MNQPVYRPPSVWITQTLLMLTLINLATSRTIAILSCFSAEKPFNCSLSIYDLLANFLALVPLGLAFWGLQKRQRYGKWLALSFLIGGMIISIVKIQSLQLIYRSITQWQPLPVPPYECWLKENPFSNISYSYGYNSYLELMLKLIAELFPSLILGFLAFRLLYSQAAKYFFTID